jgi:hypothetical protein
MSISTNYASTFSNHSSSGPAFQVAQAVNPVRQTSANIGAEKIADRARLRFWGGAAVGVGASVGIGVAATWALGGVVAALATNPVGWAILGVAAVAGLFMMAKQGLGLISKWKKMDADLQKFERDPNNSGIDPNQLMSDNFWGGFEMGMWTGSAITLGYGAATGIAKGAIGQAWKNGLTFTKTNMGLYSKASAAATASADDVLVAATKNLADDGATAAAKAVTPQGVLKGLPPERLAVIRNIALRNGDDSVVQAVDDALYASSVGKFSGSQRLFDKFVAQHDDVWAKQLAKYTRTMEGRGVTGRNLEKLVETYTKTKKPGFTKSFWARQKPSVQEARNVAENIAQHANAQRLELFRHQFDGMSKQMIDDIALAKGDPKLVAKAIGFKGELSKDAVEFLTRRASMQASKLAAAPKWSPTRLDLGANGSYYRTLGIRNSALEMGTTASTAYVAGRKGIDFFGSDSDVDTLLAEFQMAKQQAAQQEQINRNQMAAVPPTSFSTGSSMISPSAM